VNPGFLPLGWDIVTCHWISMVTRMAWILSLNWFLWTELAWSCFQSIRIIITNIRRGNCSAIKSAFTFKRDHRISWFTDANPGERDQTQIIRWILIKSFINVWHRSANAANILSSPDFGPQVSTHSTLKYHWNYDLQSMGLIRHRLLFTELELKSVRWVSCFRLGLTFYVDMNSWGQWGMRIIVEMIDRFGRILRVTQWQEPDHSQIHLQCSVVQMRV
jgi:hypothetical protein